MLSKMQATVLILLIFSEHNIAWVIQKLICIATLGVFV